MRILFAHQGFPSQFKYLAPAAARIGHEVIFMSAPTMAKLPGVQQVSYALTTPINPSDLLLNDMADAVRYGRAAREEAIKLRDKGFSPDVIVVHPGWGEGLFLRDVFPKARLVCFLEFFFRPEGNFFDFEGAEPDLETRAQLHIRNFPLLLALNQAAWNMSPTRWQKHLFPDVYQRKTTVVHEGINLKKFARRSGVELLAPDGTCLRESMEIVTFVARHLEPIRGFASFMRSVELILKRRPNAHIAIAGRVDGGYGTPPPDGQTHKEVVLGELDLDLTRIHFFGCVPQSTVVTLLQLSTVHFFITYPFLISWSVLEAMACGCVVLASDTGPAREIIEHGHNGFLIDFFDYAQFAEVACEVLASPSAFAKYGYAARATMVARFDAVKNVNQQLRLLNAVVDGVELPTEEVIALRPNL